MACATPWIVRTQSARRSACSWLGAAAILVAALTFTTATAYPGSLVAVPVLGAALLIAGGTGRQAPRGGVEILLGNGILQGGGRGSDSWYLWQWPILVLAAEATGHTSLSFSANLPYLALGLIASIATYFAIKNSIRHAKNLSRRFWTSIGLGVVLTVTTLLVATIFIQTSSSPL